MDQGLACMTILEIQMDHHSQCRLINEKEIILIEKAETQDQEIMIVNLKEYEKEAQHIPLGNGEVGDLNQMVLDLDNMKQDRKQQHLAAIHLGIVRCPI